MGRCKRRAGLIISTDSSSSMFARGGLGTGCAQRAPGRIRGLASRSGVEPLGSPRLDRSLMSCGASLPERFRTSVSDGFGAAFPIPRSWATAVRYQSTSCGGSRRPAQLSQLPGTDVAWDGSAGARPHRPPDRTGQLRRAAMTRKRRKAPPRRADAPDVSPDRREVRAEEARHPSEPGERELDPRAEPIERR